MDDKKNIWLEHLNAINNINCNETAVEGFEKSFKIADQARSEAMAEGNFHNAHYYLIAMIQLKTSIVILNRLEAVERAVREAS